MSHAAEILQPKMTHAAEILQTKMPHAAGILQPNMCHAAEIKSIVQKKDWTECLSRATPRYCIAKWWNLQG